MNRAKTIRDRTSDRAAALRLMFVLSALWIFPMRLCAWTNGSLMIWMDTERARGVRLLAKEFQRDLGVKVTIETPVNIVDNFSLAAPVRKGPDIVIWAHDKVGEWADAGLIARVEVPSKFVQKFYPQAWKAVQHKNSTWGYPVALETITLIYNKRLLVGPIPTDLAQLPATNRLIQSMHRGVTTILWDYTNAYYSWGSSPAEEATFLGTEARVMI